MSKQNKKKSGGSVNKGKQSRGNYTNKGKFAAELTPRPKPKKKKN